MKIMITGGEGMLGRTLSRHLAEHELKPVDLKDFDLTDRAATKAAVADFTPEVIIHGAAFTAVDRCESEQATAFKVNGLGSANIAEAAQAAGARLIAISTDYVFSGALDRPYHEWDAAEPQSVYGASKWAGEEAIRAACANHLICRIAWLYGPGGPSFIHTMMRLGAQGGAPLKVVTDQRGNPTSTDAVAAHIKLLLDVPVTGTMHLSCEGETTWNGLTRALFSAKGYDRGVEDCTSEAFPRPAPRPANSRLENRLLKLAGLPEMPHWEAALSEFLRDNPEG